MGNVNYQGVTTAAATVSVYTAATLDKVALFEDEEGLTPLGNPFTADLTTGAYTFWTAEGQQLDISARTPAP